MPEFVGVVKGVDMKAYQGKDDPAPRSCCSHKIGVEGADNAMQALFDELKPLLNRRVVITIEPEQTSI